ncbi:methyl-accepting chemotaxis protein [Azospirillaceae bacterium]
MASIEGKCREKIMLINHVENMNVGGNAPRFPKRLVSTVVVLTLGVALWLFWVVISTTDAQDHQFGIGVEIKNVSAEVVYLDEVLTMSALMASATGDMAWKRRYDDHVDKLDKVIARAMELAAPEMRSRFDAKTKTSNDRLVALETDALKLVETGKTSEALRLLMGEEYRQHKKIYSDGVRVLLRDFDVEIETQHVALDRSQKWALGGALAGVCVLLLGWVRLIQTLQSWRRNIILGNEERETMARAQGENMAALQKRQIEEKEVERRATLRRLSQELENGLSGLSRSVSAAASAMDQDVRSLLSSLDVAGRQSSEVARAAGDASSSVGSVTHAAEQLSGAIDEIGRQVEQSSKIANAAAEEARRTNTTVEGLVQAGQKIGEVVKLINDIASQTNLLALNATIEAARAGEAGKGFAVVASEVKNLASQTAKATEEIAKQITEMQNAARGAAEAIRGAGGSIEKINEIVTMIASAVTEQNAAAAEMTRGIQHAASATQQVTERISTTAQATIDSRRVADKLLLGADELLSHAQKFNRAFEQALASMSAAAQ